MRIFVEEYPYRSEAAKAILDNFEPKTTENGVSSEYVGYCYDKNIQDCVFFLPKVICDVNDKVFGLDPEQIVNVRESALNQDQKEFLSGLSVWVYRALKEFSTQSDSSKVLRQSLFSQVSESEEKHGTYLDILLSIKKFYEENKDFFIFTLKNIHSQQHKVNWRRTISHSSAIIQDGAPLYLDPISKKKVVNWEEELMIIFFSILEYMNRFGFGISTDINYDIIKGEMFQSYIDGLGLKRLRQIRHKYFSDKTRKLWLLCYSFFEKAEQVASSKQPLDCLMATSFHVVFESMVDTLLGDPSYDDWKKLGDGKVIDHIYKYRSLFSPDDIFYIGDSKYYRIGRGPQERSESTYKQFSYARTIVNDSIRLSLGNTWPYRDPLTEGYAVTPNFFISAETDPQLRYETDGLDCLMLEGKPILARQFVNRLFDRDTLWVKQYNLNFLYLLSVYASADTGARVAFKNKARLFFKNKTIDLLNSKYEFYVLEPKNGLRLEDFIGADLKWQLRGMCYRLGKDSNQMILAVERPSDIDENSDPSILYDNFLIEEDVKRIHPIIRDCFTIRRCALSKNPNAIIEQFCETQLDVGIFSAGEAED